MGVQASKPQPKSHHNHNHKNKLEWPNVINLNKGEGEAYSI